MKAWLPPLLVGALLVCGAPAAALAATPLERAEDAYHEGTAAFGEGRLRDALQLFKQARDGLAPLAEHALLGPTLYNLGRTYEALFDAQEIAPAEVCEGADVFADYLQGHGDEDARLGADAERGAARLRSMCEAATPPPAVGPAAKAAAPAAPASRWLAWTLTGAAVAAIGAGVTLNVLARIDRADRDDAYDRHLAAADAAEIESTAREVQDLQDSGEARATASYVFLGLGAALAGGAAWAWWTPMAGPDGGGGGAIHVGGRF
jgi:hypothetical protein